MAKVMVVGALPESLVNFRGELVRSLVAAGHTVVGVAGPTGQATVDRIRALGAEYMHFPVARTGRSPFHDLRSYRALRRIFEASSPDVVLAYTIKPVIYGGLAVLGRRGPRFIAMITGLGYAFQGGSLVRRILRKLVSSLYRLALRHAHRVIFQNSDDLAYFVSRKLVDQRRCIVVSGSGVNLEHFFVRAQPSGPISFLLIARLLVAKGIREYVEAARLVRRDWPDVTFRIIGPVDSSPDALSLSEVMAWHEEGCIEYGGEADDVRPDIARCHVYVLPSYHEGMPRTVLEAMAVGRPIITTDAPGCRETVTVGANGFLVQPGDVIGLAATMRWFLDHPERISEMGAASRAMAERRYDVRLVNQDIIDALGLSPSSHIC